MSFRMFTIALIDNSSAAYERRLHQLLYLGNLIRTEETGHPYVDVRTETNMYGAYITQLPTLLESIEEDQYIDTVPDYRDGVIVTNYSVSEDIEKYTSQEDRELATEVVRFTSNLMVDDIESWSKETQLCINTDHDDFISYEQYADGLQNGEYKSDVSRLKIEYCK